MQRGEKGFALLEVIISVTIMAIIVPAMAMVITTLLKNHEGAADQGIVLQQVQNVGYWISKDVQMAGNVLLDGPGGFPLTLDIPVDTDNSNDLSIDYLFDGNKLKRQVYDSSETLISETLIANYIDVTETIISTLGANSYYLTVKACRDEVIAERGWEVSQRVN